MGNNISR
jgi:hypothetical protein